MSDEDDDLIIIRRGQIRLQRSALTADELKSIEDIGNLDEPLKGERCHALWQVLSKVLRRP